MSYDANLRNLTNFERAAEGRKQLLVVLNDCGASQQDVALIDLQRQYFHRYGAHLNKALLRQYFGKGHLLPISQIFMNKDVDVQTEPQQTGSLFFKFKRPLAEALEDKNFMYENKKPVCVAATVPKDLNIEKKRNLVPISMSTQYPGYKHVEPYNNYVAENMYEHHSLKQAMQPKEDIISKPSYNLPQPYMEPKKSNPKELVDCLISESYISGLNNLGLSNKRDRDVLNEDLVEKPRNRGVPAEKRWDCDSAKDDSASENGSSSTDTDELEAGNIQIAREAEQEKLKSKQQYIVPSFSSRASVDADSALGPRSSHAEKHYRKVAQERRDKEERCKELRKELQTGRSSDAQKKNKEAEKEMLRGIQHQKKAGNNGALDDKRPKWVEKHARNNNFDEDEVEVDEEEYSSDIDLGGRDKIILSKPHNKNDLIGKKVDEAYQKLMKVDEQLAAKFVAKLEKNIHCFMHVMGLEDDD